MATCKKIPETEERPAYVVELTEKEATVLYALIGGGVAHVGNKLAGLYNVLGAAGVSGEFYKYWASNDVIRSK